MIEVVNPYLVRKRAELKLAETQKALMVWDAFKGQKTETVKQKFTSYNIELVTVFENNYEIFSNFRSITVNGSAKYLKRNLLFTTAQV